MPRILVTGGCGFAGSHIVEFLTWGGSEVVVVDNLSYAARFDNLENVNHSRLKIVCWDFRNSLTDALLKHIGQVDYVIHNGAQSHVASSFRNPREFVESNIIGTLNMLEAARKMNLKKFIYVSTDEVFGPSSGQDFQETDALRPTNPYAATKAAGEYLAYSYFRSFGVPVIITRTMNMYGERQHIEKFVPKAIKTILNGNYVRIHAEDNGAEIEVGSRHWLHAREQAKTLAKLLQIGVAGESYNVSSGTVKTNLEIAQIISETLDLPLNWVYQRPDEPTHDMHYSLDDSKMRAICPSESNFDKDFRDTVLWYRDHPDYLEE